MASKPNDTRRLSDVLRDADRACRESERVRSYANDVLRHRPFWPEPSNEPRHDSPRHDDGAKSSSH